MIDICFLQIRDNFKNLKFIISFLIIITLFVLNALFFSSRTESRFIEYKNIENGKIKENKKDEYNLNNVVFYSHLALKMPFNSEFIVNGNQEVFPEGQTLNVTSINLPEKYYYHNKGLTQLPPIDWLFIVSIILPFLIFIMTYDSISGEKEKGTFKMVFSNSISKLNYLLGKIAGISISVIIPFFVGIMLNILIMVVLGKIFIDSILIIKIGIFIFYSIIFILFFVMLGMFISFIANNSLKALIICSLLWIVFVVIVPVTVKISVTKLFKIPSKNDLAIQLKEADNRIVEFLSKHDAGERGVEAGKIDNYKKERGVAAANQDLANLKQKLRNNYLSKKISQAELFYSLSGISPISLYQMVIERLFGTGLERDKEFYKQTIEFQNQLVNFYKSEDQKDESSPHIYFLKDYLSSKVKIKPSEIPEFKERTVSTIVSIQKSGIVFIFLLFEFLIIMGVMCVSFEKEIMI